MFQASPPKPTVIETLPRSSASEGDRIQGGNLCSKDVRPMDASLSRRAHETQRFLGRALSSTRQRPWLRSSQFSPDPRGTSKALD